MIILISSLHLFEACLRVDCNVFVLVFLVEDNEIVIFVGRGIDQRRNRIIRFVLAPQIFTFFWVLVSLIIHEPGIALLVLW